MTGKRRYRSRLRDERAEDTRERIVTAARELFADRGVEGATVAAIARQAGVAEPTVYAVFGSKREIMAALLARTEQQAGAGAWAGQMAAEPDPAAKVGLFARWSRELFTSSHDVVAAAHRGPATAELASEGDRRRREAIEALAAAVAAAGALKPGLTARQATDRAWIITGPEVYLLAAACGWTAETYQDWLAALLREQILAPATGEGGGGGGGDDDRTAH
jgi:AcrR family transcriptional regulator